jgi:hypothetical protein
MATEISSLPNEVSQNNNVVMKVSDKVEANVANSIQKPSPTELSQDSIHQIVQGLQQAQGGTSLPSRDIQSNTNHIVKDEQVKPNFVPQTENNQYIEEESTTMENMLNENKKKKQQIDRLDSLYEELQTPLLTSVLFFIFQLPYFQKNLIKYAPSLFNRTGNYNFTGYMAKTFIFGLSVYGLSKLTKTLTDI